MTAVVIGPHRRQRHRVVHLLLFFLLSGCPASREATAVLRFVSAAVFVGGLARVVSRVTVGQPHAMMLVVPAVEFIVPPVLALRQRRLTA